MEVNVKPKIQTNLSPLANWFVSYADENNLNFSDLSRLSNLSHGTLRSLRDYPERVPTLETCLRLSDATGKPINEILSLAGLSPRENSTQMHPDRAELMRIYDNLPNGKSRQALLSIARALAGG
jgi:hypothetical protein